MSQRQPSGEICCLPFNPAVWQNKTLIWEDRLFLYDTVKQVMHVPLDMARVITRMWRQLHDADALPSPKDALMLAYDSSPWKSELYLAATKKVPGGQMRRLSGTFISRVYDGPYRDVPKWIKIQESYLTGRGLTPKRHYFYYTTCPKCAKRYRHNYVAIITNVSS